MPNKDFYKYVLDSVKDGVYFVDKDRKITFWNKSAENITGFKESDVIGQYCYDNTLNHVDKEGNPLCKNGCPLHETLKDGKERTTTVYLDHKEGHRVEATVFVMPITEGDEVIGAVETFNHQVDSDYLKQHVEELKLLAYRDQLTGLPNRRYLDQQIELNIDEYNKIGTSFSVAMIDIDHFKQFNDTYGHDVGDDVLKILSRVFKAAVRGSDFIGRWGGEEFIAVLKNVTEKQLDVITERIRMLVEKSSLRLHEPPLMVTISVGATRYKAGETIEDIFKRSDELLYTSKEKGRNQVTIG